MKIFAGLFLLFVFAINSLAAPLVFKVTKEIEATADKPAEIAVFNSAKYKKLRISIAVSPKESSEALRTMYADALEGKERTGLIEFQFSSYNLSKSFIVDTPPSQIVFTSQYSGVYKIYIWGE